MSDLADRLEVWFEALANGQLWEDGFEATHTKDVADAVARLRANERYAAEIVAALEVVDGEVEERPYIEDALAAARRIAGEQP